MRSSRPHFNSHLRLTHFAALAHVPDETADILQMFCLLLDFFHDSARMNLELNLSSVASTDHAVEPDVHLGDVIDFHILVRFCIRFNYSRGSLPIIPKTAPSYSAPRATASLALPQADAGRQDVPSTFGSKITGLCLTYFHMDVEGGVGGAVRHRNSLTLRNLTAEDVTSPLCYLAAEVFTACMTTADSGPNARAAGVGGLRRDRSCQSETDALKVT
ncbi:hypothetical protein EVAR_47895_1 [Eumeta japonica]|uniref:Uncharacterized protein n=1 Tax=Eumeta variegata TaxID=151549 RepID=A0A4C1YBD5_EUMVA|nr:hypothetical protein EVAR_47895_1 [Eumeta japonica]